MVIKFEDNLYFKAGDDTILKEVLHPVKLEVDLPYSIAYAYLEEGKSSLLHALTQTETYFIIGGKGDISLNDRIIHLDKGDCIMVEPNIRQTLTNTGNGRLEFICIVSPPWSEEGETIIS